MAKGLKVRTKVKAGGWSLNHSESKGLRGRKLLAGCGLAIGLLAAASGPAGATIRLEDLMVSSATSERIVASRSDLPTAQATLTVRKAGGTPQEY
jgi:hypothetical protein